MIPNDVVGQRARDDVVSGLPAVPDLLRAHGRWFAMIPRAYQTDSPRAPWNDESRGEPEPDPDVEFESRIEAEARAVAGGPDE